MGKNKTPPHLQLVEFYEDAASKTPPSPRSVHRLDITLDGSRPKITRRIEVPSGIRLALLHEVIQLSMGWENFHLYEFTDRYRDTLPETALLSHVAKSTDDVLGYNYDFGDYWEHHITVSRVRTLKEPLLHPRCTSGRNACPPEDTGGIWAYLDLLSLSPSTRRRREQLGRKFDPRAFDKDAVNEQLVSWAAKRMPPPSPPEQPKPKAKAKPKRKQAALYHRVSTVDQDPATARAELRDAARRYDLDVALDIEETGSGANNSRPGLDQVMNAARRGKVDVILVWKLDRFGRSALDLLSHLRELEGAGVRFVSITQGIDIHPGGEAMSRLMLTMLGAVAEFERELIVERTKLGLAKARENGKTLGRPRAARPPATKVRALRKQGYTWNEVANELECSPWAARQAEKEAVKKGGRNGNRKRARKGPSDAV